jgi:hypothetical protein
MESDQLSNGFGRVIHSQVYSLIATPISSSLANDQKRRRLLPAPITAGGIGRR